MQSAIMDKPKVRKNKAIPAYDRPAILTPRQMAEQMVEMRHRMKDLQQRVGYLESALAEATKPIVGISSVAKSIDTEGDARKG